MSKKNFINLKDIEEILDNFKNENINNYIIKFKGENIPRLVTEKELSSSDQEKIKSLLNKKRNKEEEDSTEKTLKIRPLKNYGKNNYQRNKDQSSFNCSSSSNKKINKTYNKKNKNDIDKNNNSYSRMKDTKFESNNRNYYKKDNNNYYKKDNNNYYKKKSENESKSKSESDSNEDEPNSNNSSDDREEYSKEYSKERKMKKTQQYEREGVLLEDIPKRILNVGYKNRNDKTLYCLVEWRQREAIRILDSIIETKKIKATYPNLLIDFYESKLVFLDDL